MKKRLLIAAVMAAMTISAVPGFAAPTFSGDSNIEYNQYTDRDSTLTNRIRLSVDSEITDNLYLHGRALMNNNLRGGSSNTDNNNVEVEQVFLGGKVGNFDVKAGRMPLWLGKGALADVNGLNGIGAATTFENVKVNGFYGEDSGERVAAADITAALNGVNLGASYLQETDDAKFMGINADTKIAGNAVLNMEYVRNTEDKQDGFLAEVKVGNAVKKGDFDYSVAYRDIEAGAVSGYTTDNNYDDSEGFRIQANYKVADNAVLTAFQDITDDQFGNKKNKTNVELEVNF